MKKLPVRCIELPAATARTVLRLFHALVVFVSLMLVAQAEEARFFRIVGPGATTILEVNPDGFVTWTNELTNVTCTVQTARALPDTTNWVDYVQVPASNHVVTHRLFDLNPPAGMAFIPAGSFLMGATTNVGHETIGVAVPQHTVYVSASYVDKYEVTKSLWDEVYQWATNHGYTFSHIGFGKGPNHPVHTINWYEMVKWCNARSEVEGLTPCYYNEDSFTSIYMSGTGTPYPKWSVNGYRLPTEAEWEKAARGGISGHRFPWAGTDTITHSQANYYSSTNDAYDISLTRGYHPDFQSGGLPYTSTVGYFAPNGYGVCDTSGNLWEWCWDWYDGNWYSNIGATEGDTRGPNGPLTYRVLRGGAWDERAAVARCGSRSYGPSPMVAYHNIGFRCVRSP